MTMLLTFFFFKTEVKWSLAYYKCFTCTIIKKDCDDPRPMPPTTTHIQTDEHTHTHTHTHTLGKALLYLSTLIYVLYRWQRFYSLWSTIRQEQSRRWLKLPILLVSLFRQLQSNWLEGPHFFVDHIHLADQEN